MPIYTPGLDSDTPISGGTVGDLLIVDLDTSLGFISDVPVGSVLKSGGIGQLPTWGASDSDKTFVFTQAVASSVWNITHNLNKFPSVTIVDSSNREVEGDVLYIDNNSITLNFSAAFTGKAYIN
jgi:hypothetical protein